MTTEAPAVFTFEPGDLKAAYERIQERYTGLGKPRRYATALVLARLVRRGNLREWASYEMPVPNGFHLNRQIVTDVTDELFSVPTASVMRNRPCGVVERLAALSKDGTRPGRLIVDPLYGAKTGGYTVAVMLPRTVAGSAKRMLRVPLSDASWIWDTGSGVETDWTYEQAKEPNTWNNYGQQNGAACCYPSTNLAQVSPSDTDPLDLERSLCEHWSREGPLCKINGEGCSAERKGHERTVGAPRALLQTPHGMVLSPQGLERILRAANPTKGALPRRTDFAITTAAASNKSVGSFTPLLTMFRPRDLEILMDPT